MENHPCHRYFKQVINGHGLYPLENVTQCLAFRMEVIFLNEDLVKQAHPAADMVKHMAVPGNDVVIPQISCRNYGRL